MGDRIELPLPTNATIQGPLLEFGGSSLQDSSLLVKYDHEHQDGRIEWAQVRFRGVLAFEYRQFAACEAEQIGGSRELARLHESPWLEARRRAWDEAVGSQKWQQLQGGAKRFQHFRIYFDDVGCVDVAAEIASIG